MRKINARKDSRSTISLDIKISKRLFYIIAIFGSLMFANVSQATDIFWEMRGSLLRWYATPQEACEDDYTFRNGSFFDPKVSGPDQEGNYFCHGKNIRGYVFVGPVKPDSCDLLSPISLEEAGLVCIDLDEDNPDKDDVSSCGVGNPCLADTGAKVQFETDFAFGSFSFTRTYNSRNLAEIGMGKGWRHPYQSHLVMTGSLMAVVSEKGQGESWTKVNDLWVGDVDSDVIVSETQAGFELIKFDSSKEIYNTTGQLITSIDANGNLTSFSYQTSNSQRLESVTNNYGQTISIIYQNARISSVVDPLGNSYHYSYDDNQNLVKIIYPDLTPNDVTDNPSKTYHYENTDYPNHLTGIIDENGDRYATFAYDADGQAISTEHALTTNPVGQEKFELDYQGAN